MHARYLLELSYYDDYPTDIDYGIKEAILDGRLGHHKYAITEGLGV